jgi:predicted Zn finger-like uncharacterized protein
MLIVCPSCETSYRVRPNSLPPHGQTRCLRCLAIWCPERYRAEKLLAAAAAIGDGFPPLPDPTPGEASTNLDPGCVAVPEIAAADPEQPLAVAEGAAVNPEMTSSLSPEIYFVDLEPDHLPFVAEDAAAVDLEPDHLSFLAEDTAAVDLEPDHLPFVAEDAAAVDLEPDRSPIVAEEAAAVALEPDHLPLVSEDAVAADLEPDLFVGEGPAPDQEPETGVFPEVVAHDAQSDDAVGMSDHLSSSDADVASTRLAPAEEQLHTPFSEASALDSTLDKEVGVPVGNRWLPAHLFAEVTSDENSIGSAIDVSRKEPSATLAEIAGSLMLRSGTQDESDGSKDSEREAALSGQQRSEARKRWIVLKTDYSGAESAGNAKHSAHRAALRSRRNLPVLSSALNVPPRRFVPRWPLSTLHTGILALALVDFLLVGWRVDIVRKLPQTASFYELAGLSVNLRGLAFHGITTSTVRHDGTPVLVVEGNIVNDTRKPLRVPQLRFALRDAAAQEIYSWTASADRTSLPPGQAMTFRARLASPPAVAHDVVLRFVSRRDVVASIH